MPNVNTGYTSWAIAIMASLSVSAWSSYAATSDFLAGSEADFAKGTQTTYSLVNGFSTSPMKAGGRMKRGPDQAQVRRDLEAILKGIDRARAYELLPNNDDAPLTQPGWRRQP